MTRTAASTRPRIHPAWWVAAVAFLALLGAAGFRAAPGALMVPLHEEFGWSMSTMSLSVGINLLLYGLVAPFAAALMDRFGMRQIIAGALTLVALGAAACGSGSDGGSSDEAGATVTTCITAIAQTTSPRRAAAFTTAIRSGTEHLTRQRQCGAWLYDRSRGVRGAQWAVAHPRNR